MRSMSQAQIKEMGKDLYQIKKASPKDAKWLASIKPDKIKTVYEGLISHMAVQQTSFEELGSSITKKEEAVIKHNNFVNGLVKKYLEKYFSDVIQK